MYCNRDGMRMCRSFENHLGSEEVDDVAVDLITSDSTNYAADGRGHFQNGLRIELLGVAQQLLV